MTLRELYDQMGGDYDQALRVLRVERLLDKHVRRIVTDGVVERVLEAADGMDPAELFETAHAMKGVCANLGLTTLAASAAEIADEYRPGTPRTMGDDEVRARIEAMSRQYELTKECIERYAG